VTTPAFVFTLWHRPTRSVAWRPIVSGTTHHEVTRQVDLDKPGEWWITEPGQTKPRGSRKAFAPSAQIGPTLFDETETP